MPSTDQVQAAVGGRPTHPREPHTGGTAGRLNRLRAAVLGANDGIVSVAPSTAARNRFNRSAMPPVCGSRG